MFDLFRTVRLGLAKRDSQRVFANLVLCIGALATILNSLTSPVPSVVTALGWCVPIWLGLILAFNQGLPLSAVVPLASTLAATGVGIVAWYSGGIYTSVLAYMAILVTANYFFVGRPAALGWLLVYFVLHAAMVYAAYFSGLAPPLSAVSLAQSFSALIDNTMVTVALTLVFLFYHHSDLQTQGNLERRQDQLREQTAKLQSLLGARERFVSAVSHGISPPLLAIAHWSEKAAAHCARSPNTLMVLEYNIRSALQSKLAIDDLLQYARLSAGQISVRWQYMVLRDALRSLVERLQTSSPHGAGTYTLELDKALPMAVYTDPDLFMQTLEKLIGCAQTRAGRQGLKIDARAQGPQGIVIFLESARALEAKASTGPREPSAPDALAPSGGLAWLLAQSQAQLIAATVGIDIDIAPERTPVRYWIRLPIDAPT